MKKLVFLGFFSILFLGHSTVQATNYQPLIYKIIEFSDINFNDHIKDLDYFIGKWKLLEKPILTKDLIGRDEILYYDTPAGIDGGGGRDIVYENSKYISQLILASRRPLDGLKKCHEQNEELLDDLDIQALSEAVTLFGEAYTLIREYSIRIYNIRQSFQDLSDLHATRTKVIEGQAKLREILARRTSQESKTKNK